MCSKKLDELDPLSFLTFLANLNLEANSNNASEGMVKLVLPTFLKGNAPMAYESALHVDAVHADSISIRSWVDSVQWIFKICARDEHIYAMVREL